METELTRQNLINQREKLISLDGGLSILKSRREALTKELFEIAEECLAKRNELTSLLSIAYRNLEIARAFAEPSIEPFILSSKRKVHLKVEKKNLWGVNIAEFKEIKLTRGLDAREISPLGESTAILDVTKKFEKTMEMIVEMASKEARLERLGEVVRLDTKRINAIEQLIIPRIRDNIKLIKRTLEETEREDIYRLKRYKERKSDF
ncbi:MAG: V-type ATP synthase subunit D [Deltaproteobacteria bacterium]|nr:V-type ATP synthase subunit D [Deltaproteobacteria bacterium]